MEKVFLEQPRRGKTREAQVTPHKRSAVWGQMTQNGPSRQRKTSQGRSALWGLMPQTDLDCGGSGRRGHSAVRRWPHLPLSIALIVMSLTLSAQTVSNVTAEQVGKTIHIHYDLDKAADISVFVSTDGGSSYTQIHRVSGDVGENVPAGQKTIVWDVLAEQQSMKSDDVVFKVKAQGKSSLEFTVKGVTFKMIYVKGGAFTMGCTSEQGNDCYDDERPAHRVTLDDFYIGETEVTQALWQAVMGSNPSYYKGDNRPVECVSWNDCQMFIKKLNQLTGRTFSLPTEAQWEYAARGGNKKSGYKYAGGNNVDEEAWYDGNSGSSTHPVKGKKPNVLGLYDMSGNVLEWCSDWYSSDYYSVSRSSNPRGPWPRSYRVLRGGSWFNSARYCQVSLRYKDFPGNRYNSTYGFRLSIVH